MKRLCLSVLSVALLMNAGCSSFSTDWKRVFVWTHDAIDEQLATPAVTNPPPSTSSCSCDLSKPLCTVPASLQGPTSEPAIRFWCRSSSGDVHITGICEPYLTFDGTTYRMQCFTRDGIRFHCEGWKLSSSDPLTPGNTFPQSARSGDTLRCRMEARNP